jgi:hypothetical protein
VVEGTERGFGGGRGARSEEVLGGLDDHFEVSEGKEVRVGV